MASFDPCSRPHLVGQGFVVVVQFPKEIDYRVLHGRLSTLAVLVLEILSLVNKRVKLQTDIDDSAKEKEDLAPILLVNISKLPLQHQEIILRIIVKVIGECLLEPNW
ncbi:hypothetical protein PIB30_049061 [Stylosanthes scabra]|uniref:Uncharacterized protein n=1 Tax=Stylosanthes scabra TaxID=79078 RepID=A0ABU6XHF6_9FABA|nr:hypothetical protein [Stylosanthes scabra]